MSTQTSTQTSMKNTARQMWATGGLIFAAVLMVVIGLFQILEGIAAIALGGTFVDPAGFAYRVNNTAFGWIHLVIGIVAIAAGLALFTGRLWARAVVIALAAISAIANFFYLPYAPVWSFVIMALDVFVVWAVATARSPRMLREMEEQAAMGGAGYAGGYMQTGERWPAENVPSGRQQWAEDIKPLPGETPAQAQERERANAAARSARGGGAPPSPPPPGETG
jgi:hypothetical protein